jgi:dolichyl-phosphate beta-glucosyltransferase
MQEGLSIIIPAYNEENRIGVFLAELDSSKAMLGECFEILVVDDGSEDRTAEIVSELSSRFKGVELLRHGCNLGKGATVRTGIMNSRYSYACMLDADGAYGIEEVIRGAELLRTTNVDIVIGSRVLGSSEINRPLWREALSFIFNLLVRRITGLPFRDTQCGCKCFRTEAVRPIFEKLESLRFGFDLELLARARIAGLRIEEMPVTCRDPGGSSVRIFSDSFGLLRTILSVWRLVKAGQRVGQDLS